MKKLLILAAFALPLMWTACGPDEPEVTEDIVPKDMVAVDLTKLGQPVKINAPDSVAGIMDTMATPSGIQVRVGSKFDLLVNIGGPEETDLVAQKSLIEANDAGDETFMVNDSTTLVWETKFGESASYYHFYVVVRVGSDTYYVRDNYTNTENQFTKEDVDRMLESAKSLRTAVKPKVEPES